MQAEGVFGKSCRKKVVCFVDLVVGEIFSRTSLENRLFFFIFLNWHLGKTNTVPSNLLFAGEKKIVLDWKEHLNDRRPLTSATAQLRDLGGQALRPSFLNLFSLQPEQRGWGDSLVSKFHSSFKLLILTVMIKLLPWQESDSLEKVLINSNDSFYWSQGKLVPFKSQLMCKPNLHNTLIYVTEINGCH